MTAVDPRSCSASASTARLFAGLPPPFRLTLGPVLIFAMSPPKHYEALVPHGNEGQVAATPRFVLASAGLIPSPGAGFFGYEVWCSQNYAVARPESPSVAPRSSFTLGPCVLVRCAARTY